MTRPDSTTSFLFVNESSDSPAFKVGDRQAVRSHVRKHVAREIRHRHLHKIGIKKEVKYRTQMPLASQACGHEADKFLPHDDYYLSTLLKISTSTASNAGPLAFSKDLHDRDESTIPQGSALMDVNWLESSLGTSDIDTSAPHAPDLEEDLESYYKVCRCRIHSPTTQTRQANEERMITRQRWKALLVPSPLQLLGAGRVDPFLSYPVEKTDRTMQELMDLTVTYLIPGLLPDDKPHHRTNSVNSVAKAWGTACLETPFLLHSMIFTASIHRDFMRWSQIYPYSQLALTHKLIVIQKLNEFISDRRNASRDEVILTILVLSAHEVMNVTEEKRKPFNSPLKTAQWLNVYGNIQYVPEHMNAVLDLINVRGGIENIKLHGLAEVIVICDIVQSINSYKKPGQPQLRIHKPYITFLKEWAANSVYLPVQTLATAFRRLLDYGIDDNMLQVFDAMGAFTVAVDHYLQGKPAGLSLGEIARTRIAVQKQLLLLPTAEELNITSTSRPSLYECCRLTAIIFSVGVIFPIPNTYDVLQNLAQRLKAAIEFESIESCSADCSEVLLWTLMLGGIAALEKPERPWFMSQLALVVARLKIDWDGTEKILHNFLWLEVACSSSGRQLWDEAKNLAGKKKHKIEKTV